MNSHIPFGPPARPEFFGSVTVGERGQVVIPRAARQQMGIKAGDKLLAIGAMPEGQGLIFVKAEAFSTFVAELSEKMERLSRLLAADEPRPRRAPAARKKGSRS